VAAPPILTREGMVLRPLHSCLLAMLALVRCAGAPQPSAPLDERAVVDLTYPFDEETIYWPTESGFVLERGHDGPTERGFHYAAHRFHAPEHGGTHIDAPIHFFAGGRTVDAVPVEQLIGPGIVVDVSAGAERDRDYLVGIADLAAWERTHGPIPRGAIVLLRTGFGRFWPDRARYMGTAARGAEAVAELHFPGLDPRAADWLATARSIGAVGLDTPSIDHGPSVDFASHVRLAASGIPALENVANLHLLPPTGFTVIALPMKIRGGSGGPTRVVALLD
jgi:kynurenine formamidase